MSKRKARIRNAICFKGVYVSQETDQTWIVKKVEKSKNDGWNFEIWHKHPGRKAHLHGHALSQESAVKKILKHETWTVVYKK